MATLATAWVNIVPSMKGVGQAVTKELSGIDATPAGRTVGSTLGDGILKGSQSGLSKFGSLLSKAGKTAAGAFAAAVPAIGAIGGAALDAYAEWEQAVGGVDTLFKDASKTVQRYAADAYKTAGVSANSYMNQVTSFAASLISSLGGDTAKAAEMANTALTDMSDNANKMGTDLDLISQTYQSLARGNYAMLDNLKLGYGGTKSEMERMIADANRVKQANGEMADLSVDSFADVVEAIHVVQTELGITGTTAKEAATTIEGSVGSMKAAWANWLAELGKNDADMSGLTSQLVQSVITVFQNVAPRIGQIAVGALSGVSAAIGALDLPAPFQQVQPLLDDFVSGLQDGSITLGDIAGKVALFAGAVGGLTAVGGNVDDIMDAFSGIGSALTGAQKSVTAGIGGIRNAVSGSAGLFSDLAGRWKTSLGILDANFGGVFGALSKRASDGLSGVGSTVTGLFDSKVYAPLQTLGSGIADKVGAPFKTLAGKASGFMAPVTSAFGTAFQGFGARVAPSLQSGLNTVGTALSSFFNPANFMRYIGLAAIAAALIAGLGALDQSMGGQLTVMVNSLFARLPAILTQFQTWITATLPTLIQSGVQLLMAVINGITANLPQIITTAATVITTLVNGLAMALPTLLPAAVSMIMALVQGLAANVGQILEAGVNLLAGLVQGLINAIPQLVAAIPQIIMSLTQGILSHLPQILQTGVNLLVELVHGIVNAIPQLVAAIPQVISGFVNTVSANLPQILSTGIQLLGELVSGIISAIPQLVAAIPQIVRAIWDGITSIDWLSLGLNIVKGIAQGIMNAAGSIVNAILNAAKGAWDSVLNFFGIHSPSRLMRDTVGVMVGRGFAVGITDTSGLVSRSATDLAGDAYKAFEDSTENDFTLSARAALDTDRAAFSAAPPPVSAADSSNGLSREDIVGAVIEALAHLPDMRLRLDSGVMAGELAPALDKELGRRTLRGLA